MSRPSDETASQPTVRSVERAFDLLEALERAAGPLRLVDLTRQVGLSTATTLRLLAVLQRRDLISAQNGEYRLGVGALGMAHGYLATDPLSNRARPHLQQLADATKLTTSLYVRTGAERILAVRVDGIQPFRYQLPLGRRLPLDVGAGRPILAFMDIDESEPIIEERSDLRTARGVVVTGDELRADLQRIRDQGFHISIAERDVDVASISVPVRSATGDVVAAISASGPAETIDTDELTHWVPELRRAAQAVGR